MNKPILKIVLAGALVFLASTFACAEIFFVCDGTAFTLLPDTASPVYEAYEWKLNATAVSSTAAMQDTIDLAVSTTAERYIYSLSVQDTATLCWSDLQYDTVYVLPALTTELTGDTLFCANDTSPSGTLTAQIPTLDLTIVTGGGVAPDYDWSTTNGGTGTPSGNTFAATADGTYSVSVTYTLPVNAGAKLSSCSGADSIDIITAPAPTPPVVVIQ